MNNKNLFAKNKIYVYLLIILLSFAIFAFVHQEPKVSIKPISQNKMTELEKLAKENQDLRERLGKLEPVTPVKIVSNNQPPKSVETVPVTSVISDGTSLPFKTVYQDPEWVRPDYEPYWHSKLGQFSNIAERINSSYHRIFVTPATETLWSETLHECGIAELEDKIKLPDYGSNPQDTIVVVAMQYNITNAVLLNNQIALIGTPSRNGVQVIAFNKNDIINSVSGEIIAQNNSQEYLFQLVTPDGYEIDYNSAIISF